MRTVVALALFLLIGFLGARGFVARATHRLPLTGLFATGMEFLLLGILVGPHGLDLITQRVLTDLEPVIYLSLGWMGLLFGIELSWEHVRRIPGTVFRVLVVDAAAFVVVFSAAAYAGIGWAWPDLSPLHRVTSALVLGLTASVSSPTIVAIVAHRLPARGPVTSTTKMVSSLGALLPLLLFGLLFMVVHPRFEHPGDLASGVLLWLLVNGVGLLLGLMMVLFTRERTSADEMLLLVAGTVFLIGGVCYYLEFPSLYTALVVGAVVGNFSRVRERIFRELHRIEKILFVAFLALVGAMIEVHSPHTLLVAAGYVVLRMGVKAAATATVAAAGPEELPGLRVGSGLAFSGQGVMAMAIAMDCVLSSHGFVMEDLLTVVALAVVVNDVAGFGLTRLLLQRSGEVVAGAPRRREF